MTFLEVWVGYAIIGALIFSLMFVWAVRSGQFTDMEKAHRIALNADEPLDQRGLCVSRVDRYTWIAILLVGLCMTGYTLWVALR